MNVWIALVVAEHTQHRAATGWFKSPEWETLTFSRVTQMGFLRLLTNQYVMGRAVLQAGAAWHLLEKLRENASIVFSTEPPGIEQAWRNFTPMEGRSPNFWTDAYLAAFAQISGFTLVTFDRGFSRYKRLPLKILN